VNPPVIPPMEPPIPFSLLAITCGPASLQWVPGLLALPGVGVLLREDSLPPGFLDGLPDVPQLLIHVRLLGQPGVRLDGTRRGLHLSGDEPVAPHRARHPDRLISRSAHSREEAEAAITAGADLILLSPIWRPGSKPGDTRPPLGLEVFREDDRTRGRLFALGGVTRARISAAIQAGAAGVAVQSGIFG